MHSLTTFLAFGAALGAAAGFVVLMAPRGERLRIRIDERRARR